MIAARFHHAAVLLYSGQVLIVGGIERNGVMQPSAELFDPVTGRFTITGKPLTQHGWGVTQLDSGRKSTRRRRFNWLRFTVLYGVCGTL